MAFIKISDASKAGADWISATVRALMRDQVLTCIDTVQDVRDNDFEQTRFLYVKAKGSFYRLNLSSTAADDGDTVLRDNIGRRYEKQGGTGGGIASGVSFTPAGNLSATNVQAALEELDGGIREKLTENRTYYVRTDGSDSNDGLANTAGGAFLTKQKAYDVICASLDLAGFTVTVEVEAGTYTGGLAVDKSWSGGGTVIFDGDPATPSNVLIDRTGAHGIHITAPLPGPLVVRGFKFQCTTSGSAIFMSATGALTLGNNEYGACTGGFHIRADAAGANIICNAAYSITGGALRHYDVGQGATITGPTGAVTLSGTFSFGLAFMSAALAGTAQMGFTTFSGGTITGKRYDIAMNGAVSVGGGGASFFPGSVAGTVATGGQYA